MKIGNRTYDLSKMSDETKIKLGILKPKEIKKSLKVEKVEKVKKKKSDKEGL